jgi:hypothetical protein
MPWANRAAISIAGLADNPHSSDAAVKAARTNMGLQPPVWRARRTGRSQSTGSASSPPTR